MVHRDYNKIDLRKFVDGYAFGTHHLEPSERQEVYEHIIRIDAARNDVDQMLRRLDPSAAARFHEGIANEFNRKSVKS